MANPNVISLSDYMNPERPQLVQGIVQQMREDSPLLNMLQFHSENRLKFYNRVGISSVEGGSWKAIGEEYPLGKQVEFNPIEETTFYVGRMLKMPRELVGVKDGNVSDPLQEQVKLYTQGIQRQVVNTFMNGVPTDNSGKSFTGLKYRITNNFPNQVLEHSSSAALDLRLSASSYSTNVEEFIVLMNKLCKKIDGGKPDFFIVNEDFQIKFESILRTSKLLSYAKDNMEREFPAFKGIPFIDAGRLGDDSTYVITSEENHDGTTASSEGCTSIYAVKQDPSHMIMLEKQPFNTTTYDYDPYNIQIKMEWALGMMITHPRSVARLRGIRVQ